MRRLLFFIVFVASYGLDGYPQPIFDKTMGAIDHTTAEYWREHYDLDAILQRDWSTLGPKLQGKLHIYWHLIGPDIPVDIRSTDFPTNSCSRVQG